jgi:RHS repeat-associated protein
MNKDISTMRSMTKFLMLLCLLVAGRSAVAQTTGTVTYVYTDPQGTPLAEADAHGNITATFDYTPYGSTALGTPPNGPGYTGHVNDPETNLVYMQARYYDPAIGHFLSVDPDRPTAGNGFNFNRYAYVNNNPINHIDRTGKCIEDFCIGEAILVTEGVEYVVSAYEASEVVAVASETATATTATTATSTALSQTVAQCAANTTCSALAVTSATAITAKTLQAIQDTSTAQLAKEHTKNARPSSKGKHEQGNARRKQDAGNEKGDDNRRPPKQRPPNYKGPWPPPKQDPPKS